MTDKRKAKEQLITEVVEMRQRTARMEQLEIERRQAEERVGKLREFYESIVLAVEEGLLLEDAHGIITFVNPALEKLLGYSADELVGAEGDVQHRLRVSREAPQFRAALCAGIDVQKAQAIIRRAAQPLARADQPEAVHYSVLI